MYPASESSGVFSNMKDERRTGGKTGERRDAKTCKAIKFTLSNPMLIDELRRP